MDGAEALKTLRYKECEPVLLSIVQYCVPIYPPADLVTSTLDPLQGLDGNRSHLFRLRQRPRSRKSVLLPLRRGGLFLQDMWEDSGRGGRVLFHMRHSSWIFCVS